MPSCSKSFLCSVLRCAAAEEEGLDRESYESHERACCVVCGERNTVKGREAREIDMEYSRVGRVINSFAIGQPGTLRVRSETEGRGAEGGSVSGKRSS